jgi:hypothetical protein
VGLKWSIISCTSSGKFGELRPMQAFSANYKARICNECFEPPWKRTQIWLNMLKDFMKRKNLPTDDNDTYLSSQLFQPIQNGGWWCI